MKLASKRAAMRRGIFACAALALSAGMCPAQAQTAWPTRPIKLIVNYPPGSSPDVLARVFAPAVGTALGQPMVIENRAGASGLIGADAVAKSAGDGYTLLMTAGSTVAITPAMQKMPFDPVKDLTPVASIARIALFLVERAGLPPKDLREFLAYVKERPGKLTYGSAGNGTGLHIAGEMLKSQAGLFVVHVPYRGAAPALQDLMAGHIDFYFDPGISFQHVRAGRLRMLAVGSLKRSPLFPDIPTLAEAGLPGFDAGTTHGVFAPGGTPPEIVNRLNAEINRQLATPALQTQIHAIGAEPEPLTPAAFADQVQKDLKRYTVIIRERNIRED
ncbi:MAG TPA: tripartite tricarboxylate transporter substrate binding protein [Burkholderiales bacterium]